MLKSDGMSQEEMIEQAVLCETEAIKMKEIGDFHAYVALKQSAEAWLNEAAELTQ